MAKIDFFKATSTGKLEEVEASASSLHYRRSLVVKDEFTKTIWVFHGSSVAKKTKANADKSAEEMNKDNSYEIVKPEPDDAAGIIEEILENQSKAPTPKEKDDKKPKSKKKQKAKTKEPIRKSVASIPKTPLQGSSSDNAVKPKGDLDQDGPEIKEFQIAYFEHPMSSTSSSQETFSADVAPDLIKQALEIIAKYIVQVNEIISKKPSQKIASSQLNNISKEIINLIYQ